MLVIGPAIIVSSVATRYYVGGLVGLALVLWGVWETPEIHPYLKVIINWKSRKQVAQIKDSSISGIGNVQAQRDVIIQVPKDGESPEKEELRLVKSQRTGDKSARLWIENFGKRPVYLNAYAIGASRQEFLGSRRLVEPGKTVVLSITTPYYNFENDKSYDITVWSDQGTKFPFVIRF